MLTIQPRHLAFKINTSFLPQWHKKYLEKATDQKKKKRSLWNNSGPPKTYCCMKLITTCTTALHWRKFILILPSENFSCTQTDELLKEKAWDEVNKRASESGPWMGLYVRRLVTIRKMLKSCLKSKEMSLLLCATDENHTKAANLICSNSRMHSLNIWKALGWNWTKPFTGLTFQFILKGIAVSEAERYFSI